MTPDRSRFYFYPLRGLMNPNDPLDVIEYTSNASDMLPFMCQHTWFLLELFWWSVLVTPDLLLIICYLILGELLPEVLVNIIWILLLTLPTLTTHSNT